MENIDSNLKVHFPALNKINADLSNIDEIGKSMLKKKIKGKKEKSILYSAYAMALYNERALSVGARKTDKPGDKSTVWNQIKREFYSLICTKDRKYTKIRKKLFTSTKQISKYDGFDSFCSDS